MVEFCIAGSVALEHAEKANCNHIYTVQSQSQISITDNIAKPTNEIFKNSRLYKIQGLRYHNCPV